MAFLCATIFYIPSKKVGDNTSILKPIQIRLLTIQAGILPIDLLPIVFYKQNEKLVGKKHEIKIIGKDSFLSFIFCLWVSIFIDDPNLFD